MITVVMEALQDLADKRARRDRQLRSGLRRRGERPPLAGVSGRLRRSLDLRVRRACAQHASRVSSRVLKVLWLLQRITWVPRVPETLAKLLVRDLTTEIAPLRDAGRVRRSLALQEAGYVARDEATGEWKFLNERERTIEQAIQEMVRPGGPKSISIAAVRRTAQQLCKDELVTRKKLANFAVTHGTTKVPFSFGVHLDGEAVETGAELEVVFTSPLAPGRKQDLEEMRRQNQAAGAKGKTVWWVADAPDNLEPRFKRYEALVKVTSDKRFTEDSSTDTQDALSEKRKERDELKTALVRDLERAFLAGTLFYGGQEISLEGVSDLKEPSQELRSRRSSPTSIRGSPSQIGCSTLPSNSRRSSTRHLGVCTRSRPISTSSTRRAACSASQRSWPRCSRCSLISRTRTSTRTGRAFSTRRTTRASRGFSRAPFGWPDELVRLLLAACLRAGAVYIEQQTHAGPTALYDYKGTDDIFAKITSFKKATFRVAETSLSVDQIKRASKALIAMGVTGTPESGNAIAAAVRTLGLTLKSRIDDAHIRAQQGLPDPRYHLDRRERADRAHDGEGPDRGRHRVPREGRRLEVALPVDRGACGTSSTRTGIRTSSLSRRLVVARRRPPSAGRTSEASSLRAGSEGPRCDRGREVSGRALVRLSLGVRRGVRERTATRSCRATTKCAKRLEVAACCSPRQRRLTRRRLRDSEKLWLRRYSDRDAPVTTRR